MSVRSELKELVEWISDLSAESEPARQAVYRENWRNVETNLEHAVKHFESATAALGGKVSPLDEFTRDLKRETEGLRLRATLLQRRAPPKPSAEKLAELTETVAEKQKALDVIEAKLQERKSELDGLPSKPGLEPKEKRPKVEKPEPKTPSEFVDLAAHSLEWAHRNILKDITTPDAVADAFENELDLLAEMTLSLRLQLEALEAEN